MSREIKFKIFNKAQGIILMPYQYKNGQLLLRMWDGKIVDVYKGEKREELIEYEREHLIPLQFTGLKDKNGKEIYEGDVIRYKSTKFIGEVKYRTSPRTEFYLWGESDNHELYSVSDLEVIGNIYENPELLNKEIREENR